MKSVKRILALLLFVMGAIFFMATLTSCDGDSDSSSDDSYIDPGEDPNNGNDDKENILTIKSNYPSQAKKENEEKTYDYESSKKLPNCPFSCSGYICVGYGTNLYSSDADYQAGDAYTKSGKTTIYALWGQTVDLTIIFDSNSDSQKTNPTQKITLVKEVAYPYDFTGTYTLLGGYNKCNSVKLDELTYTASAGTILLGLAANKNASSALCSNGGQLSLKEIANSMKTDSESNENTLTLYALWATKDNCYKITFNGNGGSSGALGAVTTSEQYVSKNDAIFGAKLDLNPFEKKNYVFKGWSKSATTQASDSSSLYKDGSDIYISQDTTLYAIWERDQTKVILITYKANDGIFSTTEDVTQEVEKTNSNAKLKKNTFLRTGYEFKGWAKSSYGDKVFEDEATIDFTNSSFSNDLTLYAVWKKRITVTFDGNGGATSLGATQTKGYCTEGDEVTLLACPFTKSNYVFTGWATSSTGSVVYEDRAKFTSTRDTTLYAVWVRGATVTFGGNGGLDKGGSSTKTVAATPDSSGYYNYTLPENTFTKSGYIFMGWTSSSAYKDLNSTKVLDILPVYAPGTAIKEGTVSSYYAAWVKNELNVNYYAYDKTCYGTTVNSPEDQTVNIASSDFLIQTGATGKKYYVLKSDKTVTIPNIIPTHLVGSKANYGFFGWTTSDMSVTEDEKGSFKSVSTCSGATSRDMFYPGDKVPITKNTTLYPVYIPVTASDAWVITYDNNSGGVNNHATYYIMEKDSTKKHIVQDRFLDWKHGVFLSDKGFSGWSTSKSGSAQYSAGDKISVTGDITLYAIWQ